MHENSVERKVTIVKNYESKLHKYIGELLTEQFAGSFKVVTDTACGGRQRIPLFCSEERGNESEYCNVDMLIHDGNKILVIVEIEESNVKPTQICGKFFTSAFSKYYIHNSERNKIKMGDNVLFIQIVDTKGLKPKSTSKYKQWRRLEESIKGVQLPIKYNYKLFPTNLDDLENGEVTKKLLIETIAGFLDNYN